MYTLTPTLSFPDTTGMVPGLLTLLSGFNATILSILLYAKNKNRTGVYAFRIGLLLSMAAYCGSSVLRSWCYSISATVPLIPEGIFLSLMGPLLYGYIHLLTGQKFRSYFVHFFPTCVYAISYAVLFLMPQHQRVEWLQSDFASGTIPGLLFSLLLCLQLLVYLSAAYCRLRQQHTLSGMSIPYFRWMGRFIAFNITFILCTVVFMCFRYTGHASLLLGQLAINSDCLFLFVLIFMHPDTDLPARQEIRTSIKNSASRLNAATATCHLEMLDSYMRSHKPYLKEDCNLNTIAHELKIAPYLLSQCIHDFLHKNFTDYINEQRIEEIKRRLCNPAFRLLTIETIAIECGFSSKTTFNRAFKKHSNNQTPSTYRKRCNTDNLP